MSVLRSLESKLAGLVEGTFSRAFKSEVRPVEIARKLAKEMDDHKVQSLSRVYAPNEYAVWLSAEDRKQFEGHEDELARELSGYLLEHARREKITLGTSPRVDVQDRRAAAARRVRHPGPARAGARARARPAEPGRRGPHDGLLGLRPRLGAAARARPAPRARAAARRRAAREVVGSTGAVLGRSRDADVVLDDPNVSRHHAEVRPSGGSWIVNDLGSTNGIKINGRRVNGPAVAQAGRRDRAGHLAGDLRAGVADGARSDRRRA